MQLYHGDCLDIMAALPDNSVDLVLADPPYGTTACAWDAVIPFVPMWSHLLRVAKRPAAILLFASQPFTSALVMSNPAIYRHEWIWKKDRGSNFANTVREPMKEHESVLMFSRGRWVYHKQLEARRGKYSVGKLGKRPRKPIAVMGHTITERIIQPLPRLRVPSSVQPCNVERGLHPTQKPVRLLRYLIRTYSDEGAVVLDFCAGSGSTGEACADEGRDFIGIEKDPAHFATMQRRVTAAFARGPQVHSVQVPMPLAAD